MTTTPRILLVKRNTDGSESMALGDDDLRANWTAVDTYMGAVNVATVAAIATPFVGQIAFESTNDRGQIRGTSAWGFSGSPKHPKGLEGTLATTGVQTYAGTLLKVAEITISNLVANQLYLVRYSAFLKGGPGSSATSEQLRFKSSSSPTVSGDATFETRSFEIPDVTVSGKGANVSGFCQFSSSTTGKLYIGMWWDGGGANGATLGIASSYYSLEATNMGFA